MDWMVGHGRASECATEVLAIVVDDGPAWDATLEPRLGRAAASNLREAARAAGFKGEKGSWLPVTGAKLAADCVLLVGLGAAASVDLEGLRRAAAVAATRARAMSARRLALLLPVPANVSFDLAAQCRCCVEGAELTLSQLDLAKGRPQSDGQRKTGAGRKNESAKEPRRGIILVKTAAAARTARRGVAEGEAFAGGTLLARRLVNLPPNYLTPRRLASEARSLARREEFRCQVLGPAALRRRKMGGILGVARGSAEEPRLIRLESRDAARGAPKIALVGKGVTFDAGGISIKPAAKMDVMKCDMAGAAAVLGAAFTVARLRLPVRLQVVVPAVENLPDGRAIKPADVLTLASGQTVEVLNTDAEGRLILADALHFVCRGEPDYVLDIATLTGACAMALGKHFAGMMGNSAQLADVLAQAGGETFERVWPLPMVVEHREAMESPVADIKNLGPREAGASTAGAFLSYFVPEQIAWSHLDVAGTAWSDSAEPLGPRGGTGFGARLLARAVQILVS